MAKLIKLFRGVPNGAIYPVEYQTGDECPEELEAGARELGALEDADADAKAAIAAKLEAAGIAYDKRWGVAKLQAALDEAEKAKA